MSLLILGGELDYNLHALITAAEALNVEVDSYLIPKQSSPEFHWSLENQDFLYSLGVSKQPQAAFIRQDFFAYLEDPRPAVNDRSSAWHTTLQGWLLTQPEIALFNQKIKSTAFYKPAALYFADQVGLRIPKTVISNNHEKLKILDSQREHIVKPVNGGGHCQLLSPSLDSVSDQFLPTPAIIQNKLIAPEYRIFVIGSSHFCFHVDSPSLDYREKQDAKIYLVDTPTEELNLLKKLMHIFHMDFGAADFKTDPNTGHLVFLELNTSPMFAAFDSVSQGKLCQAMVKELLML